MVLGVRCHCFLLANTMLEKIIRYVYTKTFTWADLLTVATSLGLIQEGYTYWGLGSLVVLSAINGIVEGTLERRKK